MKAVGVKQSLPITEQEALVDIDIPKPSVGENELLIKVTAVAVNPVDTKIRMRVGQADDYKVLGWDAVGVVESKGTQVSGFEIGDRVYYAGDISKPGCNAEYHCVDYRIVGHAPQSLDDLAAAALPLTSLTAWELSFDRLQVNVPSVHKQRCVLIFGAAGGVGSIMIQLLKQLTDVTVIATASRDETQAWVKQLGADYVINHHQDIKQQLEGLPQPTDIALLTHSADYFQTATEVIAPQGRIGIIDDPEEALDIRLMKQKSVSLHWEFMYTRSLFETADISTQRDILNQVAELVNAGKIRSTEGTRLNAMSAATLKEAHQLLESGKAIGKIVLPVAY
ncbi:zinc-binding alcohol dehydrogenase family protein [Idiomarina fontislapidosi]|uniref:Zinc-type alcohol dehydrogenase-like protein n=1 Tax=Idiomarina fontislapidosi TaxID=263723 RepID=A0A432YC49_9GAMM|nr:zinc-binding alcohol dehydrogenase family protein [Idiomarina fontislapidosi]PYE35561.1 zinc-binding alcohol dehydrogenase family protein [Idiomarina fontislapidosi]RUO58436.1 zinc-binding alcohol dehydrogenase family protein [Idiomarina fontislapidosi]